ncbi:MAG: hypothetical protein RJA36_3959 [Pseudomonadota bacterium]|jgi:hypothetical protein
MSYGAISMRVRGKTVADVLTNGHELRIACTDGSEVSVVWLDDNGAPLKGKPAIVQHGARLLARGVDELIHYPAIRERGHA